MGTFVNTDWEIFVSTFSDRLKKLRGEMKQAEFARKIGLAQNSYNRYEAGERVPDIDILSQMASRLGVSTDWLLGREDGKDAIPPVIPFSEKVSENHDPRTDYCPACVQKDKTIARQAESIVNLTRSLAIIVGRTKNVKTRQPACGGQVDG